MLRYIVKRLFISLITVWVLATITFFLIKILPGDPFLSDKITPEIKQHMIEYYGFDKSLPEQYVKYMGNLLKGDLGASLRYRARTVNDVIKNNFPHSADLGIRALIFGAVAGILLGVVAALNQNKPWDYLCIIIAIIGVSVPGFIVAGFIQYWFGVKLHWLPVGRYLTFRHTIMPAFALGLGTLAGLARLMRTSMLEVVGLDFIKTAKAKGLSPAQVTWRHQIRNAMLPVVTVLGPTTAGLLTGSFVIEKVFAIPGLGQYFVNSIANYDYPMVLGTTIFFGAFLVLMNLIVDIVYGLVDPRIRIE